MQLFKSCGQRKANFTGRQTFAMPQISIAKANLRNAALCRMHLIKLWQSLRGCRSLANQIEMQDKISIVDQTGTVEGRMA